MLDFSFKHWKQHSPYLKGYLALTLKRVGPAEGRGAGLGQRDGLGEDDRGAGHLLGARGPELALVQRHHRDARVRAAHAHGAEPGERRRDGLVQWLLLDKKLNHWKSTRATAEVVYSLVHYLEKEGALGVREDAKVTVGDAERGRSSSSRTSTRGRRTSSWFPARRSIRGRRSTVVVEKTRKGFVFASATWHFSTEKLPAEDRGDFFQVSRRYFRRENQGRGRRRSSRWRRARSWSRATRSRCSSRCARKHDAEYVHLRDPRAAGLEPENAVSRTSGTWGSSGTRRRATRGRTSSSSGCRRASTRSSTGCARTWRARSGSARRRCSPCTRPSSPPTRRARCSKWPEAPSLSRPTLLPGQIGPHRRYWVHGLGPLDRERAASGPVDEPRRGNPELSVPREVRCPGDGSVGKPDARPAREVDLAPEKSEGRRRRGDGRAARPRRT